MSLDKKDHFNRSIIYGEGGPISVQFALIKSQKRFHQALTNQKLIARKAVK